MFRHFKNQAGQIMALTLMITGVGALSTGAMLGIITTSARSSGSFHDNTESYYAAAAGIEIVIADLLEGKDALDTGDTPYQVPQLDVNGRPVKISIAPPAGGTKPRVLYRYIDPGTRQGLSSLAPGATWSVKLNGVTPFSSVFVNWAFSYSTADVPELEIRVLDSEGQQIVSASKPEVQGFPANLKIQVKKGSTYTVEFENKDTAPIVSRDFTIKGGQDRTWIFMKAVSKEYIITAEAGVVRISAYVRQLPGPGPTSTQLKHMVLVESWQQPVQLTPTPQPPTPTPPP